VQRYVALPGLESEVTESCNMRLPLLLLLLLLLLLRMYKDAGGKSLGKLEAVNSRVCCAVCLCLV
jgi:hypothetical protein